MSEFDAFQGAVLATYHEKRETRGLSTELETPTPARLKQYCLHLLVERQPLADDEPVLRMFFGPMREGDHLEDIIRRFDIEKFKPLIRFLKGETSETNEKNIKLLAWLIDFEPRPYERWRTNRSLAQLQPTMDSQQLVENQGRNPIHLAPQKQPTTTDGNNGGIGYRLGKQAGWIAFVAAALVAAYLWFRPSEPQCMYWYEDRYLTIDCTQGIDEANVIARDDYLLENFRKITNTDTLTLSHAGRVWYSKIDNVVEFFTGPGMHPVQTDRSLKAATEHIIEQYALIAE